MLWRLRMHRIRRFYNKVLRWALAVGAAGMVLFTLSGLAHQHFRQGHDGVHGWMLAGLGGSVLLAGIGHALGGAAPTLQEYADEATEELPGISKLFSGLLASCGGVAIVATGIAQMIL